MFSNHKTIYKLKERRQVFGRVDKIWNWEKKSRFWISMVSTTNFTGDDGCVVLIKFEKVV